MKLATERLVLREFQADDGEWVHSFASDEEVTRYTDWGPNTWDETSAFIDEQVREAALAPRTSHTLAVTADGIGVGSAGLRIVSAAHRRGELGYVLHPSVWGRGYATELTSRLMAFAFEELALHRVQATCHPDNAASARVLEKSGMKFEGRMRGHLFVRGIWRDSLLYAAIRD
jgi:[ribosomal protein S5]-alanine N-acetyltransferase